MIKVSIIIPIYNPGSRLNKCLETLVNQTLPEVEIICILDCPTDGSEKIAKEYATKDKRIKLIYNKKNIHVSASRNKGIEIAQGEYIGFSDDDDYRELTMYEELYITAKEKDVDIVFSDTTIISEEYSNIIKYKYKDPSKTGVIGSIILPMEHSLNKNILSKSVWSSLYKNSLIP